MKLIYSFNGFIEFELLFAFQFGQIYIKLLAEKQLFKILYLFTAQYISPAEFIAVATCDGRGVETRNNR
jgi:hypothetical protein